MEKHEIHDKIEVVYTKEFESADNYIEKFVKENADEYIIRVATSDSLEQRVILGLGGARISARELKKEIEEVGRKMDKGYINLTHHERNLLEYNLDPGIIKKLEKMRRQKC